MAHWVKLLLAIVLILLVAGCGGSASESTSAPQAEGGGETAAPTPTRVKIMPTDTPVPPPPTPVPTDTPAAAATATAVATEAETDVDTKVGDEAEATVEAEAEPEIEVEEPAESDMITIPAGEFGMGSDQGDESPAHTVLVEAFEIDKFEVTNAEFDQFVKETGYETDAEKNGDPNLWRAYFTEEKAEYPVVKVSWNDASAYCPWAGKRLPTEAEWEKAARGTDEVVYPWGDTWDVAKVNSKDSGFRGPVTVGSFPDGASPYGAMDMAGNVWEWTADWYQGYPQTQFTSNYFGETYRVLRGGGWFSEQDLVRTTKRNANSPDAANDDIGFRCAR